MKVAVLGAGGTIAPAIVRDLAESEEVTALRLLDLDPRRAEEVAIEHGGGKAQARQADATSNLAEQLAGFDALVNSAAYRINLAAMEACVEVGCHYLDLGGLYHVTAEQLRLSSRFKERGLLALLGIGSAPGKTNLLAARAVRELPGEPVSIAVSAAGRDLDPPDGISFPYALRTLLDEITMPPMALVDGRAKELRPLQSGPRVDFGEPIGEAETIFTLHSEVLTFGSSFGAGNVTFALSLPPAVLESLRGLEEASEEAIAERARTASPPSSRCPERAAGSAPAASPSHTGSGAWAAGSSRPPRRPPPRSGCSSGAGSPTAERFRPSSASTRTRCSRSSRPAECASR